MRAQCATSSGPTQMTAVDGEFPPAVPDTHLDRFLEFRFYKTSFYYLYLKGLRQNLRLKYYVSGYFGDV